MHTVFFSCSLKVYPEQFRTHKYVSEVQNMDRYRAIKQDLHPLAVLHCHCQLCLASTFENKYLLMFQPVPSAKLLGGSRLIIAAGHGLRKSEKSDSRHSERSQWGCWTKQRPSNVIYIPEIKPRQQQKDKSWQNNETCLGKLCHFLKWWMHHPSANQFLHARVLPNGFSGSEKTNFH